MPFLENVTRGRGVPRARLEAVAQHYLHFGGVSPINRLNRDIIARLELDLPVYFGNRNWHPLVEDTVARMAADGVRDALVFPTSAWGGYSGCLQYHEDIRRAQAAVPSAPRLTKLRQYYDHPLLVEAFADSIRVAQQQLSTPPRLVFTAHSIPESADAVAGPPADGGRLYRRQVAEAARLCAAATGFDDYDVVWQSRSGPPHIPWLEPDILDHLDVLADKGVGAVLVCPVGFVSDHLEVVWDLDNEARERAAELGVEFARAATPGPDARFTELIAELVAEHTVGSVPRHLGTEPSYGCTVDGAPCAVGCCTRR